MIQTYTAVLVFKRMDALVALVRKESQKLPHLNMRWNGIGGKIEIGESPVGSAIRELREETGIIVEKDNMVIIEHQRLDILTDHEHHIYWYAARVPNMTDLPPANDVGELLKWVPVKWVLDGALELCPNLDYLVPKAIVFLRSERLARPC